MEDQQQQQPEDEEGTPTNENEEWLEPAFLNPNDDDVVEVDVGDDDVPMEDDDDDDDDVEADEYINEAEDQNDGDDVSNVTETNNVPDTSVLQIKSHTGPVYCLAAAPLLDQDSILLVSGGGDDRAYVHRIICNPNAATAAATPGVTSSTLLSHVHTDTVSSVVHNIFPTDTTTTTTATTTTTTSPPPFIAVGGFDGAIVVYDAVTGSLVHTFEGPTDVEWLYFHRSGTVLLAGSATDGTVWMYHVILKSCLQVFVGHAGTVTSGGFTPDGKWAVTCGSDGSLRIWAPKTGVAKHTIAFPTVLDGDDMDNNPPAGLTCLAFGTPDTANSKLVMVGSEDGQAHVVHTVTGKILHTLRHYEIAPTLLSHEDQDAIVDLPMSVEAVAFCPNNPLWCATGGVDGVLKIWDLTNGQIRQICRVVGPPNDTTTTGTTVHSTDGGGITHLSWHTTLPVVFTATTTGTVRLWDARNGALLETLTTGSSHITLNAMQVLCVSDTKTFILTAGDDNTVRLFDVNVQSLLLHGTK